MEEFWHSWIVVAVAVPVFYALDSVLDVFFVDRKIYRDPVHATVISGLFSVLYLFALVFKFKDFQLPELTILAAGIGNGMFYIGHVYFYFRVLFKLNDASNLECFLGFSVILVPAFAFIFLGEKLTLFQYIGTGISVIGVLCLFLINIARDSAKHSFLIMSHAVIILSLTFIIQDKIYQYVNFYTGLVLFLTGQVLASLVIWRVCRCRISAKQTYKFGPMFLMSQLLGVAAVVFSQRAINISPSVTYVVAIETTTPLFIMIFSFLAIPVLSYFRGKKCFSIAILHLQLTKLTYKLFAFGCLLVGILLTSSPDIIENYIASSFYGSVSDFDAIEPDNTINVYNMRSNI